MNCGCPVCWCDDLIMYLRQQQQYYYRHVPLATGTTDAATTDAEAPSASLLASAAATSSSSSSSLAPTTTTTTSTTPNEAAAATTITPPARLDMIQSYVVKVASKQDAMLAYYAEALSDLLDKRNGGRGDLVSAHVLTGHFRRELTSDNSHNCTLSVYIATTVPSHAPVYIVSDTPQAVARACYATLLDHSTGQRAQTQLHLVSLQYFSVEQLRADRSTRSAKNPDYTCGKQTVDACNVRLVEMQCTFCMD